MSAVFFEDIFGQAKARRTLASAMRSGRMHHAWIFHGPPGVGKRTTAEAFAAALLSPGTEVGDDDSIRVDRGSAAVGLIESGTHPDLHIVVKELAPYSRDTDVRRLKQTSIPVAVVREFLVEPAVRTAQQRMGGMADKVFIVDEAELLAPVAQNALLKILEEPPAGSVIILVTSAPQRLLPTIRSRCQRVSFEPLDDASMERWLEAHLSESDLSPAKAEREWALGAFASGSPGRALLALEGGFFDLSREVDPMLERAGQGEYPATLGKTLSKFVDEWAKEQVADSPQASKDAANKAGARHVFALLLERARRGLAEDRSRAFGMRLIRSVEGAERELASNVQMNMVMEHLASRLCRD